MEHYDAIIIGSGIGGLTTAALLAKIARKRVLVVEKHWTCGGLTHEFSRPGGFQWDVGLHYVGRMAETEVSRKIMDFVTGGRVAWQPLPDPFDRFVFPDFTVDQPADAKAFALSLARRFPAETSAIHRYFEDVQRAVNWFQWDYLARVSPAWMAWPLAGINAFSRKLALQTTGQYLERHFSDPQLQAVLAAQWGNYGIPPYRSAFVIHAVIVHHYLTGAWYPVGGAGGIAREAARELESVGGACRNGTEVTDLVVANGAVAGVRLRQGQQETEIRAPLVFSNIGAHESYHRWLNQYAPVERLWDLSRMSNGDSCVTLYLGLREDPRSLGVQGENYWIHEDYDLAAEDRRERDLLAGRASQAYLSFSSMKNSQASCHSMEIIAMVHHDWFLPWADQPWGRRGADYDALKQTIASGLIDLAERHLPGLRALIAHQELATPLSLRQFTSRHRGTLYGLAATPQRHATPWLTPRTPLPGFYLTGSDACACGIVGAMAGGVAAAVAARQIGWRQLFRALRK